MSKRVRGELVSRASRSASPGQYATQAGRFTVERETHAQTARNLQHGPYWPSDLRYRQFWRQRRTGWIFTEEVRLPQALGRGRRRNTGGQLLLTGLTDVDPAQQAARLDCSGRAVPLL